jgi:hypothetical protein
MPIMPLSDTMTDLPFAGQSDSKGLLNGATFDAAASSTGELPMPPKVIVPISYDPMAVLWPLTVFVLAPMALVGVILLLWFLMQRAI